ncbi:MAG: FAD-linked oxidase C-terminal domain-containing protein [Armatimonadota bacterium]|nr:FAD-linked oxidase C-terminal domain-containing protein [Armatimonadota bacterium]
MDLAALRRRLQDVVGAPYVLYHPDDLLVYEQDAIMVTRHLPDLVVLPGSTDEVAAVVRIVREAGLPIVARGAGTGLSGGAIPESGGVVVALARMIRVLDVDVPGRTAIVEAGLVNAEFTAMLARDGLFFAPDPGSQVAATIGGNVANNSGGPHCLAYGVTGNHVLGVEVVLYDGSVVWLGGPTWDAPGYDLCGVLIGSEGTLGIVTKVAVRLMRRREAVQTLLAVYHTLDDACAASSAIIAAGIVPEACEIIDGMTMKAVNATLQVGFPDDAEAALLVEVEGLVESLPVVIGRIETLCRTHGATRIQTATSADERLKLWKGRKHAGGALGKLARNTMMLDVCAPRSRLVEAMREVAAAGARWGVRIANFFHAGDGNMHPNLLFDFPSDAPEFANVMAATEDIMESCVRLGGTITGEHGVGIEKREYMVWMFGPPDIEAMKRVKTVFDPDELLNPHKVFPTGQPVHGDPRGKPVAALTP